jgi:hypothetical protein
VKNALETQPTVIDEAYMERYADDALAYKAWTGVDLAQDILFDDESCADSLHDAKFEVAQACMALRVLVRRLTGMDAEALRKAVHQRQLEALVLGEDIDQLPAWETLQ